MPFLLLINYNLTYLSEKEAGRSIINRGRVMEEENPYFGRMNDPTGAAWVKGICGEEIEFYLYIRDRIIEDAKYFTEGCGSILSAGRAVAEKAEGKKIEEALHLNPGSIIESEALEEEDQHCAILAVIALLKAIADYLLKP